MDELTTEISECFAASPKKVRFATSADGVSTCLTSFLSRHIYLTAFERLWSTVHCSLVLGLKAFLCAMGTLFSPLATALGASVDQIKVRTRLPSLHFNVDTLFAM